MSKPRSRKVGQADVLAKAVATIRKLREEQEQFAKQMFDKTLAIGKELTRVKPLVGHGNWGTWLKQNFQLSEDTAENYMRLPRLSGIIKFRIVRNLPLAACYVLAGHTHLPPEFFADLTRRVDAGERPTAKQFKTEIRTEHRAVVAPYYKSPRTTVSPVYPKTTPADHETYKWSHAFHRFLEALVNVANIDKPSAREFAEGVRADQAPEGLDAAYLGEIINLLTGYKAALDGDMPQMPRLVDNDKGQPMPMPRDEEEGGSGNPPKSLH
jgi:hypothetical protein